MVASFVSVWTAIVTFFVGLFESIGSIFYTVGTGGAIELTFIGTLGLIMAGVSMILLAFNIIRSFLPIHG